MCERDSGFVCDAAGACVLACVRERGHVCERVRVRMRVLESVCMCERACAYAREQVRVCACVRECVRVCESGCVTVFEKAFACVEERLRV